MGQIKSEATSSGTPRAGQALTIQRWKMLKMFIFLRRSPALSRDDFAAAWLQSRREALEADGGIREHARRYAFNAALAKTARLSPTTHEWNDEWDGIDEFWFDEPEQLKQAQQLHSCNPLFGPNALVDQPNCRTVVAREAPNAGGPEVDVKIKSFILIKKLPQLSQSQFFYHWTVIHPPIWTKLRRILDLAPPPKSVKNYLEEGLNAALPPFGYDGIAEGWHTSLEEMERPFQTPEHDEMILPDSDLFRQETVDILAAEHVLHGRI
jgi:hypothetical protein